MPKRIWLSRLLLVHLFSIRRRRIFNFMANSFSQLRREFMEGGLNEVHTLYTKHFYIIVVKCVARWKRVSYTHILTASLTHKSYDTHSLTVPTAELFSINFRPAFFVRRIIIIFSHCKWRLEEQKETRGRNSGLETIPFH